MNKDRAVDFKRGPFDLVQNVTNVSATKKNETSPSNRKLEVPRKIMTNGVIHFSASIIKNQSRSVTNTRKNRYKYTPYALSSVSRYALLHQILIISKGTTHAKQCSAAALISVFLV